MNSVLVFLCLAVAATAALPTHVEQASVLDFLKDLENVAQEDGKVLMEKMINVIHYVEDGVLQVKELVPKVYEKIHQEADEVLAELEKMTEKVEEFLERQKAQFGFDLLSGLTELPGGTKLSTVLDLISLAAKAHRVIEDAKEFTPHLEKTLNKIQSRIETHIRTFGEHVLKELGLGGKVSLSVMKKIEELFEKVDDEAHKLLLDLLYKMEGAMDLLEFELPELYGRLQEAIKEIRGKIHELLTEVEKSLVMRSFSLLDLAGNLTGGTDLSTAFKVMSLIDKFNKVVQDARTFGPKAEEVLQHSVKRVADSAQEFFNHAAQKLLSFD